ncbi:ATP-dependent DNA helicase [Corynebacterium caspium]|uniref:ATP-dependent DNA helicase n=1 Tax=Corynebacterium caspium TaxID=234828 RepID=UPI000366C692|nr:ATP-dependent DNA helicase [Corynebacterium caspium]WKD59691.1 ATP-dependent DNA helicase PcrA [Corynebacterium caspium DSM 44850]
MTEIPLKLVAPQPQVRLVAPQQSTDLRSWEHLSGLLGATAKSALDPVSGVPAKGKWRVRGTAGSGVSSLLVDTALAAIARGEDPAGILIITPSKEAAGRVRQDFTRQLIATSWAKNYVADNTIVRSVHSVAFGLLRQGLENNIRLITGAEHDAIIRELLAGQLADGKYDWPADAIPALETVGFARQLRDFLLRAAERGLNDTQLQELGQQYNKPIWASAGSFLTMYRQIARLAGSENLNASELVSTALAMLDNYPEVLEQGWHTVLIDDAQHLDPRSGELLRRLIQRAQLAVIAGDPQQSIFHFRGASPEFLQKTPVDYELELTASRRHPEAEVLYTDSPNAESAAIAGFIRRAHLLAGIPWSEIAVIVRSQGQIDGVRRNLLAAGVPVHITATNVILSEQRLVASIILATRALNEKLQAKEIEELVLGPIGGADPVVLRRLLRGLRRFDMQRRALETLQDLLRPQTFANGRQNSYRSAENMAHLATVLTERELEILSRIQKVLDTGATVRAQGGSVEEILWAIWAETGLADRLANMALSGGAAGSQADRDLDAMMSLFDLAGDFVERRENASINSFIEELTAQELPTGVRDRRGSVPEAVTVLSAHGATGRQWKYVVITGVQDDRWPALGETGSMFEQEEFVDLVDRDIDPNLPLFHSKEILAEERRLFHVATTRPVQKLLITAVDNLDGDEVYEPSRFIGQYCAAHNITPQVFTQLNALSSEAGAAASEAAGAAVGAAPAPELAALRSYSGLSADTLVAELRRVVSDPNYSATRRTQAARQLARLATGGVPGAHPQQWWSRTQPSTAAPLLTSKQVSLSPSAIERLGQCPLNAELGPVAEETESTLPILRGKLVHAFAETLAHGADAEIALPMALKVLNNLNDDPLWRAATAKEEAQNILERTKMWLRDAQEIFEEVGVEVPVEVEISPEVIIRGRMDRLQKIGEEYVVVDLKTGKTPLSQADTENHAQLGAYQLALSRGEIIADSGRNKVRVVTGDKHPKIGGASLVYLASTTKRIAIRTQAPLDEAQLAALAAELPLLAAAKKGPTLLARVSKACTNCRLKPMCPLQPEGKPVTNVN